MMLLVDAHNGNWFINNRDPTKFFAIDFGRLVQVDRATMTGLYSTYLAKNFDSTGGVPPTGSVFFPNVRFGSVYDDVIKTALDSESFYIRRRSDAEKDRVFANIHKCLVMAAIFDNIVTDDTYDDWNQPQMAWAYKQIWGYRDSLDVNEKQPVSNFPNLSIDYGAFSASIPARQLEHVKRSYDGLCNVIVQVNATVSTGAFASRPGNTTTRPQTIVAMGGGGSRHRRHKRNHARRTLKNKNQN